MGSAMRGNRTTFTHRHTGGVFFCVIDPIKTVMDKWWMGPNVFVEI